jgi:CheY-like chemotaxis protein
LFRRFVDGVAHTLSTVLIVDDDPSTRLVMRMILERDGHEIVEAGHGATALELIQPDRLPDIVTTDMRMPVLGGMELIRRLRAEPRTAAIPIIVVSSDTDAIRDLRAAGLVHAIVVKPFDAGKFIECVRGVTTSPVNGAPVTTVTSTT